MTSEKIVPVYPSCLFLLPGEDLPLCAFDASIIEIVSMAAKHSIEFGLIYKGLEEEGTYGTLVRLKKIIDKNKNGEMVVLVTGITCFKVDALIDEELPFQKARISLYPKKVRSINKRLIHLLDVYVKEYEPKNPIHINDHVDLIEAIKLFNLPSSEKFLFFVRNLMYKEAFLLSKLMMVEKIRSCERELNDNFSLN